MGSSPSVTISLEVFRRCNETSALGLGWIMTQRDVLRGLLARVKKTRGWKKERNLLAAAQHSWIAVALLSRTIQLAVLWCRRFFRTEENSKLRRVRALSLSESSRWQTIIDFWRKIVKLAMIVSSGSGVAAVSAMVSYHRSTGQSSLVHKMSGPSYTRMIEGFRNLAMPHVAKKNTVQLICPANTFNFGRPCRPHHLLRLSCSLWVVKHSRAAELQIMVCFWTRRLHLCRLLRKSWSKRPQQQDKIRQFCLKPLQALIKLNESSSSSIHKYTLHY